MGTIKRTREELIQLIKKVLVDLYDEKYVNKWVESRERPITRLIIQNGLQSNYSCAFTEVLKQKNILETRSAGVAMQYFLNGESIPDFDIVAEQIYQNYIDRAKRHRDFDGYPESKESDCRPKQVVERKTKAGKTIITKREEIKLGDMVYLVKNDMIVEGKVVGMQFNEYDKITYRVKYFSGEYIANCNVEKPFRTLEGILFYLRNNFVKYAKK